MKNNIAQSLTLLGTTLALSLFFLATQAQAQPARTWVSGVGDDINPCSRTAPCKTFAGAISKTAAGGEISVLDPGGFGTLTITKSISITNDGAGEAGILASGTNGITISAGSQDVIRIHGLVIDGGKDLNSLAGIRFNSGGELHVENCLIKNFQAASTGYGIYFTNSTPANLYISDTVIVRSQNGQNGGGIFIKPTKNGGVNAVLNRVQSYSNLFGIKVDGSTSTNRIRVTVRDSVMSLNTFHGMWVTSTGAEAVIFSDRNVIVENQLNGVLVDGAKGYIMLNASTITSNDIGLAITGGGTMQSFKNNSIYANPSGDGAIPPANILPQN